LFQSFRINAVKIIIDFEVAANRIHLFYGNYMSGQRDEEFRECVQELVDGVLMLIGEKVE
jgi:hypothetical protein